MFYDLAASSWGNEELAAIQRVVDSNHFTMGPHVAELERRFADYFGMGHAVMVNSGSSANLVAVAALCYKKNRPLRPGDEVIVPAISWSTTFHPFQQYGLRLRFVDVDLASLNLDVSRLDAALTSKTRAIVAVSILGNPAVLDVIRAFADRHGLYLLEDNCESMDARLPDGRKTGTFGDINTFSFFFSHHISTMEGGMALTNDLELCHLMRSLRAHGWTRDLPADSPLFEPREDDFFEAYRFILPGYNLRPLEFSGAIGLEQLKKLPDFTTRRRANLKSFQTLFAGDERFILQREYGTSSSFCFTLILHPALAMTRKPVLAALKRADIGYRIITGGNFLRHDVIRHYDYSCAGPMTHADIAHDRGFFVGNHSFDLTPQLLRLREVLDQVCR